MYIGTWQGMENSNQPGCAMQSIHFHSTSADNLQAERLGQ